MVLARQIKLDRVRSEYCDYYCESVYMLSVMSQNTVVVITVGNYTLVVSCYTVR